MSRKHPEVAIAYDFDGTLSPGNMQEYDFIPKLGMKKGDFWRDAMQLAKDSDGDPILAYLNLMLRKANANEVEIRRNNFVEYGKGIELFPGVEEWFDRIDAYERQKLEELVRGAQKALSRPGSAREAFGGASRRPSEMERRGGWVRRRD